MNLLLKYLYRKRAVYYSGLIKDYIKKNEKVLDIGAGSGYIAEILSKKADLTLLDIKDYNQTRLPLKLYDGKNIPFKDNSFDAALILTVLHYAPETEKFLKEVKRVSRKIIIIDDVYKTKFGKFAINLNDAIISNTVGVFTKFNFKTDTELKRIFQNLNLRVVVDRDLINFIRTTKQKMYVLEKQKRRKV
jgi:ubiquinone/menaquinone biosynthesis C-methylase UbiE